MNRKIKITAAIITVAAIIIGASAIYLGDYYRADQVSLSGFKTDSNITVTADNEKSITVYSPAEADSALIFYPGGKVEHTSYEPLMKACASRGIMCILVEMPFNLAVFNINAAEGIRELYPEIDDWYIGGHSLGGSMAANCVAQSKYSYDGLVLLAAYSTSDLTLSETEAISIYGSEDGIMNREKYYENTLNLPVGFEEYIIQGGNHAYFGMYGSQDGDGNATISNEEQIIITADKIAEFID